MLIIIHLLILIIKKSYFLLLGTGSNDGINGSIGFVQQKKISVNFSNAKAKYCFSLHYNGVNSYTYINKTEIYKFKVDDEIYWYEFCLGYVSKKFTKDEQSEISLNDTA